MILANTTPQLVMRRPHLRQLPQPVVPEGYAIRHFQPGDEAAWEQIILETFESTEFSFEKTMRSTPVFAPERVLFVTQGEEPVATASAWVEARFGPVFGYLHMVGVRPGHQGRQLGFMISMAALHQFVREGRIEAVLQTDDFRLPAIKVYLRMGFEPLLVHGNQRGRWRTVLDKIAPNDLAVKFAPILEGPVASVEGL